MEIVIAYVALCFVAATIAKNKGKIPSRYFLLSLVLSPVIGIAAALVSKPDTRKIEQALLASGESKKCPFCAELVKPEANVCRFCGKVIPLAERNPTTEPDAKEPIYSGTYLDWSGHERKSGSQDKP